MEFFLRLFAAGVGARNGTASIGGGAFASSLVLAGARQLQRARPAGRRRSRGSIKCSLADGRKKTCRSSPGSRRAGDFTYRFLVGNEIAPHVLAGRSRQLALGERFSGPPAGCPRKRRRWRNAPRWRRMRPAARINTPSPSGSWSRPSGWPAAPDLSVDTEKTRAKPKVARSPGNGQRGDVDLDHSHQAVDVAFGARASAPVANTS